MDNTTTDDYLYLILSLRFSFNAHGILVDFDLLPS